MKRILTLVTLFFAALTMQAQSFQFTVSGNMSTQGPATSSEFELKTFIRNLASTANPRMKWEVSASNIPSGWAFYVCDPGACQNDGVTSAAFPLDTNTSYNLFSVHFKPNGRPGTASLTIKVYDSTAAGTFISKTFSATSWGNAAVNIAKPTFSIYPNPANDLLTVNLPKEINDNATIEVYNMLGKKMKSVRIGNAMDRVNVEVDELPRGTYIIRVVENGSSLFSRTFLKN